MSKSNPQLKIAFIHPDLGLGGAERLVVDAAISLQSKGHKVELYTSYYNPDRAFAEIKQNSLSIHVWGQDIPREFMGRGHVVFAILKSWWLAVCLLIGSCMGVRYDVFVVDQLSASIPILRMTGTKILFYCHFPDKLLTKRDSFSKKLYRFPIDLFEEITTKMADVVVVNSKFTASIFTEAFKLIPETPRVLYPGILLSSYDKSVDLGDSDVSSLSLAEKTFILSINRFERKKNIGLAIESFAMLKKDSSGTALVLAGGWDARVTENVEYLLELKKLASSLGLKSHLWKKDTRVPELVQVLFLTSFTDPQRNYLLANAACLLYTPSNEHFGIVPLEAMYCRLPVIACRSGGPMETIQHEISGFLCDPTPESFSAPLEILLKSSSKRLQMGKAGRDHVSRHYSLTQFGDSLDRIVRETKTTVNFDAVLTFYSFILFFGTVLPLATLAIIFT